MIKKTKRSSLGKYKLKTKCDVIKQHESERE